MHLEHAVLKVLDLDLLCNDSLQKLIRNQLLLAVQRLSWLALVLDNLLRRPLKANRVTALLVTASDRTDCVLSEPYVTIVRVLGATGSRHIFLIAILVAKVPHGS